MNWKNRLTNYNFWVSIVSAVLLILQALKIKVDFIYVNEVSTAVLGLLVVIGIINDPTKSTKTSSKKTETTSEQTAVPQPTEEVAVEPMPEREKDQKNLENQKNEAKNTENNENLSENLKNSQNLVEIPLPTNQELPNEKPIEPTAQIDNSACATATKDEKENNIPTDNENEGADVAVQNNLSHNEIEIQTLQIVN